MRVWLRAFVAIVLFSIVPFSPMHADEAPEPARVDAAMEMIQAIGVTKQMDTMVEIMITQFASSMTGIEDSKKAEAKQALDAFSAKFRSYQPEMVKEFATLYAKRFTVEELQAITAFYRSQPGMKFVAAAPELMRMGGEIGGRYGQKAMQEVNTTQGQQ